MIKILVKICKNNSRNQIKKLHDINYLKLLIKVYD